MIYLFDLLAHGSGSDEVSLLCHECRKIGLDVCYYKVDSQKVADALQSKFGLLEITEILQYDREFVYDVRRAFEILENPKTVIAISSPKQFQFLNSLGCAKRCFFRHGLNSFEKFASTTCQNFWSIDPEFPDHIPYEINFFRAKKFLWLPYFNMKRTILNVLNGQNKEGFISLVSHYEKHHPQEYQQFQQLRKMVNPIYLKNHGHENQEGWVNDLDEFSKRIGLVHIKNKQIGCNAVIRALAMGKPIFALRSNVENLKLQPYVINQKTGFLAESIEELAQAMSKYSSKSKEDIDKIETSIPKFLLSVCAPTKEDVSTFYQFLERCLKCWEL